MNDKELSVAQIMAKFCTVDHFRQAYEAKGKVLPDNIYLGWNYIKQILTGEKLLINKLDLTAFTEPPRSNKKTTTPKYFDSLERITRGSKFYALFPRLLL